MDLSAAGVGVAVVATVATVGLTGVIVYANRQRRRAIAAMEKRRERNQREAEKLLRESHPVTGRPIGNYGPGSRRDHVRPLPEREKSQKTPESWANKRMAEDAAARKRREDDHEEELRRRRIDNDTQTQTVGFMSPSQPYYRQDDTPSRCDSDTTRHHTSSPVCSPDTGGSWGGDSGGCSGGGGGCD